LRHVKRESARHDRQGRPCSEATAAVLLTSRCIVENISADVATGMEAEPGERAAGHIDDAFAYDSDAETPF
jgi:hypothetical protein